VDPIRPLPRISEFGIILVRQVRKSSPVRLELVREAHLIALLVARLQIPAQAEHGHHGHAEQDDERDHRGRIMLADLGRLEQQGGNVVGRAVCLPHDRDGEGPLCVAGGI
jgi:hypothetical protein